MQLYPSDKSLGYFQSSALRTLLFDMQLYPSDKSLGYFQSSALRTLLLICNFIPAINRWAIFSRPLCGLCCLIRNFIPAINRWAIFNCPLRGLVLQTLFLLSSKCLRRVKNLFRPGWTWQCKSTCTPRRLPVWEQRLHQELGPPCNVLSVFSAPSWAKQKFDEG